MTVRALASAAASLAFLAGCGRPPDNELWDAHEQVEEHGHVHRAPHGGTLVVLAEESAHLEIVHDPAAGKLTAYVLDAHAEHGVRVEHPSLAVSVRRGDGEPFEMALAAVANPLTGETAGDTSEFSATDERLRGPGPLEGSVVRLGVRGAVYAGLPFRTEEKAR